MDSPQTDAIALMMYTVLTHLEKRTHARMSFTDDSLAFNTIDRTSNYNSPKVCVLSPLL